MQSSCFHIQTDIPNAKKRHKVKKKATKAFREALNDTYEGQILLNYPELQLTLKLKKAKKSKLGHILALYDLFTQENNPESPYLELRTEDIMGEISKILNFSIPQNFKGNKIGFEKIKPIFLKIFNLTEKDEQFEELHIMHALLILAAFYLSGADEDYEEEVEDIFDSFTNKTKDKNKILMEICEDREEIKDKIEFIKSFKPRIIQKIKKQAAPKNKITAPPQQTPTNIIGENSFSVRQDLNMDQNFDQISQKSMPIFTSPGGDDFNPFAEEPIPAMSVQVPQNLGSSQGNFQRVQPQDFNPFNPFADAFEVPQNQFQNVNFVPEPQQPKINAVKPDMRFAQPKKEPESGFSNPFSEEEEPEEENKDILEEETKSKKRESDNSSSKKKTQSRKKEQIVSKRNEEIKVENSDSESEMGEDSESTLLSSSLGAESDSESMREDDGSDPEVKEDYDSKPEMDESSVKEEDERKDDDEKQKKVKIPKRELPALRNDYTIDFEHEEPNERGYFNYQQLIHHIMRIMKIKQKSEYHPIKKLHQFFRKMKNISKHPEFEYGKDFELKKLLENIFEIIESVNDLTYFNLCCLLFKLLNEDSRNKISVDEGLKISKTLLNVFNSEGEIYFKIRKEFLNFNNAIVSVFKYKFEKDQKLREFGKKLFKNSIKENIFFGEVNYKNLSEDKTPMLYKKETYAKCVYSYSLLDPYLNQKKFDKIFENLEDEAHYMFYESGKKAGFVAEIIDKYISIYPDFYDESEIKKVLKIYKFYYHCRDYWLEYHHEKKIVSKLISRGRNEEGKMSVYDIRLFIIKSDLFSEETKENVIEQLLSSLNEFESTGGKDNNESAASVFGFMKNLWGLFANPSKNSKKSKKNKNRIPQKLANFLQNQISEIGQRISILFKENSISYQIIKTMMNSKQKGGKSSKEKITKELKNFIENLKSKKLTLKQVERFQKIPEEKFKSVIEEIIKWCKIKGNTKQKQKDLIKFTELINEMKTNLKNLNKECQKFKKSLSLEAIKESVKLDEITEEIKKCEKSDCLYSTKENFVEKLKNEYSIINTAYDISTSGLLGKKVVENSFRKKDWKRINEILELKSEKEFNKPEEEVMLVNINAPTETEMTSRMGNMLPEDLTSKFTKFDEDLEMSQFDPHMFKSERSYAINMQSLKYAAENLNSLFVKLKIFFKEKSQDFKVHEYRQLELFISEPEQYTQMLNIMKLQEKEKSQFTLNISLIKIYLNHMEMSVFKTNLENKLKLKFELETDIQFFKSLEELKLKKNCESSSTIKSIMTTLNISPEYLNTVSKIISFNSKLKNMLKLYAYYSELGLRHINDIIRDANLEKYSLSRNDFQQLKKLITILESAFTHLEKTGYLGFAQIFLEKFKQKKDQNRYSNYIKALEPKTESIIRLSREFLDTTTGDRSLLKSLMENSVYIFSYNNEKEVYEIRVQTQDGKKVEEEAIEEQRIRRSIASFENMKIITKEDRVLVEYEKTFLEIYKNVYSIKEVIQTIHEFGYIFDLKEAVKENMNDDIIDALQVNDKEIKLPIGEYDNKKIVEDFEKLNKIVQKILEEIQKTSNELQSSEMYHWLTKIQGSQFKVLVDYISSKTKPKTLEKKAMNILRYCFETRSIRKEMEAEMKNFKDDPRNIHPYNCFKILSQLSIETDQNKNDTGTKERVYNIKMIAYDQKIEKYQLYFNYLALKQNNARSHSRYLFCTRYTKKHNIYSFLQRALLNKKKMLFVCVDIHVLTRENFNYFLSTLQKMTQEPNNPFEEFEERNKNLVILVKSDTDNKYRKELEKIDLIREVKRSMIDFDFSTGENEKIEKHLSDMIPEKVFIYESEFSGLGKSQRIEIEAKSEGEELVYLFLAGDLSPKNLTERLKSLENQMKKFKNRKIDLFIKLDMMEGFVDNIELLDQIIFQVVYLRCLNMDESFLFFNKIERVFIEIGNTFKKILIQGLSILQLFYKENLVRIKGIEKKMIDFDRLREIGFDYVTNYLNLYNMKDSNSKLKLREIDEREYDKVFPTDDEGRPKEPEVKYRINDERRIILLLCYFQDSKNKLELKNASFSQLVNFIKTLENQFRKFSNQDQLKVKMIEFMSSKEMEDKTFETLKVFKKLRSNIVRNIIRFARQYCWSNISEIRSSQQLNKKIKKSFGYGMKEANEDMIREHSSRMGKLQTWENWSDKDNATLFFGKGCLKAIYKDPKSVPESIAEVIKVNMNEVYLPNLRDFEKDDFLKELAEALDFAQGENLKNLRDRSDNFGGKGYVITMDNYLKILLICQRADLGLPIIIQGETGCGKTYMINYISSCLLQEEFRCFTLHSGITEKEFIQRLTAYVSIAKNLKVNPETKSKRLWVLIDEFNTSPLQSLLSEIMIEKKCTFSEKLREIPDNIVFVACCNPFRVKMSKGKKKKDPGSQVGLVHESTDRVMSHMVFPIPESLINYVWDFGQLDEVAEAKYIDAIISGNAKEEYKYLAKDNYKNTISASIYESQKFIRRIENDSSVSLRDVQRFITLFKFFHGRRDSRYQLISKNSCKYDLKQSLALTITMCYLLRIGIKEKRVELAEKILKKIKKELNLGRGFDILEVFDDEAKEIAEEAMEIGCIPEDISINKPLKENLFVCLCCLQIGVPVLMCGKPGTSKTVSIDVLTNILSSSKRGEKTRLRQFTPCNMTQYQGSLNTTAKSIQNLFNKVKSEYETNPEENRAIIFDEVGLAEIAPGNPLKVLHPLLDPSSEDKSEELKKLIQEQKEKNTEEMMEYTQIDAQDTKKEKTGVSFIGISNWRLDISKMNRILFVSRPDMDVEDLESTCNIIFDTHTKKEKLFEKLNLNYIKAFKKPMKKMFSLVSRGYFSFREMEMESVGHQNFHGSRDFYSLIKEIINSLKRDYFISYTLSQFRRILTLILFISIERNFSGREFKGKIASRILKEMLARDLKKSGFPFIKEEINQKNNVFELIRENLKSKKSRHLMIFTEGAYLDNIIIDKIKEFKKFQQENDPEEEFDGNIKVVYFMRSETREDVFNITAKLPKYIEEGYTVIMKDLDNVYGSLYDLLNQKYEKYKEEEYCYLFYEDVKKKFKVNKKFRCILLMPREDGGNLYTESKKKQPAPFLNRFEKHLVKYENLMSEEIRIKQREFEKKLDEKIIKFCRKSGIPRHVIIHNFSKELLVSLATADDEEDLKNRADLTNFGDYSLIEKMLKIGDKKEGSEKNTIILGKLGLENTAFEKMFQKLMILFSRNAILSFFHTHKNKETLQKYENKLQRQFMKTHPVQNLTEFVKKIKKSENSKKSIIFTFTYSFELKGIIEEKLSYVDMEGNREKLKDLSKNLTVTTVEEINREGKTSKSKVIQQHLSKPECEILIIQFTEREDWKYIEYFKSIIDDILNERDDDEEFIYKDKKVVFIAHYSAEDFNFSGNEKKIKNEIKTSINFMTKDWEMYAIDDLVCSDTKDFFKLMKMTISQFFDKEKISKKIVVDVVIERLTNSYQSFLSTEEDQITMNKIIEEFSKNTQFTQKIFETLRDFHEDFNTDSDKKLYQIVIEKNMLGNLSINYIEAIKDIISEKFSYQLDRYLVLFDEDCRFVEKVILEENKTNKTVKLLLKKWDEEFNNFRARNEDLKKPKDKNEVKKMIKFKENCLEYTLINCIGIGKIFKKLKENIFKNQKINNLVYKKDEDKKLKGITHQVRNEILKNTENEIILKNDDLREFNQLESVKIIFGTTLFNYKERLEILKFINKILKKIDTEFTRKKLKSDIICLFISFALAHKDAIELIASICKDNEDLSLNKEKNVDRLVKDIKNNKGITIDTFISGNILAFMNWKTTKQLKENLRILVKVKKEYKEKLMRNEEEEEEKGNSIDDGRFEFLIKIVIEFFKEVIYVREKNIGGLKKAYGGIFREILTLGRADYEMYKEDDDEIDEKEKINYKQIIEIFLKNKKIPLRFFETLYSILLENLSALEDNRDKSYIIELVLKMIFEKKFSKLRKDYYLNYTAEKIVDEIGFNWNELKLDKSQDFIKNFSDYVKFDIKDKTKLKFLMLFSDQIIRKFRKETRNEDLEKNPSNPFAMDDDEIMFDKTPLDILQTLTERDISVERVIKEGSLMEFLTDISLLRVCFYSLDEEEERNLKEVDKIINKLYDEDKTKSIGIFLIQILFGKCKRNEKIMKNLGLKRVLEIKEEIKEENQSVYIYPDKTVIEEKERIREALRKIKDEEIDDKDAKFYSVRKSYEKIALMQVVNDIYLYEEDQRERNLRALGKAFCEEDKFYRELISKKFEILEENFPSDLDGIDSGDNILKSIILNFFGVMEQLKNKGVWKLNDQKLKQNISQLELLMKKPSTKFINRYNVFSVYKSQSRGYTKDSLEVGKTIWNCNGCGLVFTVGNCGKLNQFIKCPTKGCKNTIGGDGTHNANYRRNTQMLQCSIHELERMIKAEKKKLKIGYVPHKVQKQSKLNWGLAAYHYLENYPNVVYSHMLTHLVLLYRALKFDVDQDNINLYLEHILFDFELMRSHFGIDHDSLGFLVTQLNNRLSEKILGNKYSGSSIGLVTHIKATAKLLNSNKVKNGGKLIVSDYKKKKNYLLDKMTTEKQVLRNLIDRSASEDDLEIALKPEQIFLTKMLRIFTEFSQEDFQKFVADKEKYEFLNRLNHEEGLYIRLSSVLYPLINLTLYLSSKHRLSVSEAEAREKTLQQFAEEQSDERLKKYAEEAQKGIKENLDYITDNYYEMLEFNQGCEKNEGFLESLKQDNTKLILFMVTESRDDDGQFMKILIDGLIKIQNNMIDEYEEIFEKVNENTIVSLFKKGKGIDKVPVNAIEEENILKMGKTMLETIRNTASLSTEFLKENEFLPHLDEILEVAQEKFFKGKVKIQLVSQAASFIMYRFKNSNADLLNEVERFIQFIRKDEKNFRGEVEKKLKKNIEKIKKIEKLQGLENFILKVLFELEENVIDELDKELGKVMKDEYFKNLNSSLAKELKKVKICQLMDLSRKVMISKGENTAKIMMKETPEDQFTNKKNLISKIKEKKIESSKKIIKKVLPELYLSVRFIDNAEKLQKMRDYSISFFDDEFNLFKEKFLLDDDKLFAKITFFDLIWVIDELKKKR